MVNYINSNKKEGSCTPARISAARAEEFLHELANLSDDSGAIMRFKKLFPDILPSPKELHRGVIAQSWRGTTRNLDEKEIEKNFQLGWVLPFREELRSVWRIPDWRTREWRVFKLREAIIKHDPFPFATYNAIAAMEPIPPLTPFEQTLLHLLKSVDRARCCGNPDCPAPYFFAKRRSQKYCTDACSKPAQREFKKRWWAEKGPQWRKARKASAKKSQRKRRK